MKREAGRDLLRRGFRSMPSPVRDALTAARRRRNRRVPPLATAPAAPVVPGVWEPPPIPLPSGLTLDALEQMFMTWSVNGEPPGHMRAYVDDSLWRFFHTWALVRGDAGACLELGANPYFTTYLLEAHTDLELTLANFYGNRGTTTETLSFVPPQSTERVEVVKQSAMFNVEEDEFPYETDSFDVVLFCEMIEHLLMDPLAALGQIHRVLKPGGTMVLTTPNVCRLRNVFAMVNGANLYDPYSGYGPYGRHNREYTRHELHRLLDFAGFDVEYSLTADGHAVTVADWPHQQGIGDLIKFRSDDLGHYLFVRARANRPPREGLPSSFYRSWPPGTIVDYQ